MIVAENGNYICKLILIRSVTFVSKNRNTSGQPINVSYSESGAFIIHSFTFWQFERTLCDISIGTTRHSPCVLSPPLVPRGPFSRIEVALCAGARKLLNISKGLCAGASPRHLPVRVSFPDFHLSLLMRGILQIVSDERSRVEAGQLCTTIDLHPPVPFRTWRIEGIRI